MAVLKSRSVDGTHFVIVVRNCRLAGRERTSLCCFECICHAGERRYRKFIQRNNESYNFELQPIIMPMEIVVIVYSVVLQEGCVSPFEDLLQPLDDRPCRAACGIWRT